MKPIKRRRVSKILKKKARHRTSEQREWFLREANQMIHCREPYWVGKTKMRKKWCSKGSLCPGCKARKAKINYTVLHDQFQAYDPKAGDRGSKKWYEVRISRGLGNISG